jgi:hypothetical protein
MKSRFLAAFLAVLTCCAPGLVSAQASGSTVMGRILEISAGLPVSGAKVELRKGDAVISSTTTASDGSFTIGGVSPGTYSLFVSANNYNSAVIPGVVVEPGQPTVLLQTALVPGTGGLKTIASTTISSRAALSTSATINSNLDPSVITDQNYARAGDALSTLPFVTNSTSSALGDDETISLRGFDPTESVTLLDGHPIGPIGAHGNAYDYQLAQFWGLANASVIYGSGAAGLYGVPTMAGAVNFETINPTLKQHFTFTQGLGALGHQMTGITLTDTIGRVGYALAYGVDGTSGELTGNVAQTNLLYGGQNRCNNSPSALVYLPLINASGGSFNGGGLPVDCGRRRSRV